LASQPAQPAQFVDYIASMSWIAAMSERERTDTLARVRALVDTGETHEELTVQVVVGLTSLA
jgi:hypothetical protein